MNDLVKTDIDLGDGTEATAGRFVSIHYTGWLYDESAPENKGEEFDSTRNRMPFEFPLGIGQVIKGWDRGVVGMKVGGHRRLIIPPEMGYGKSGAGILIQPNATLVFDIELMNVN